MSHISRMISNKTHIMLIILHIFYLSKELECEPPTFPEFSKKIQEAIDEFGAVFIKSNWSTPSVRNTPVLNIYF